MKKWILIVFLALVTACAPATPAVPTPNVDATLEQAMTVVVATMSAAAPDPATPTPQPQAQETETPTPAPAAEMGIVTGALSFPSEGIPAMRVVAFEVNTGHYMYVDTASGQNTYTLELPAGVYHIVVYLQDGSFAGGYTQMVPCGLDASCEDHSMIDVQVGAGATVSDIDPGDWYAPEGTFPPMPAP